MQLPPYSPFSRYWQHDPEIVFLNHGSFGSTPIEILKRQQELRMQMESESVRFMVRELYELYQISIGKLVQFIGADPNDLVFVKNATMGVNTVIHSLDWEKGDEILIHSHAYGACANTIRYYANKYGVKIVCATLPFPVSHDDEIIDAFIKEITPKTKLALVDHITSPTGIIFPVETLVEQLQAKGVDVLVDGAHAPGQIPLHLKQLNAAYYVGNCHKWICSPKGSAFLQVRKDKQEKIFPLQISHEFDAPVDSEKKWQGKFFWPGTDDYTAYCCVGDAIDYMSEIGGGWKKIMESNREKALKGRALLSEMLDVPNAAPEKMIANLATIPLGEAKAPEYGFNFISPLQNELFHRYKIEVPIIFFSINKTHQYVRIATQLYNSVEQIEYLGRSLKNLLRH